MMEPIQAYDRDNLQHQLFRHYTLLFFITTGLAIWLAINHDPFSLPLVIVWSVLCLVAYGLNRLAGVYPNLMCYLFVGAIYICLIAAMFIWDLVWILGAGMLFTFISIVLQPRVGLAGAVGVLIAAFWLATTGHRAYPVELFVLYILSAILAWLLVNTLYTALLWYRTMHNRADQLLQEARDQRSELKRTLQSLEAAYEVQQRIHAELISARRHADEARRAKERFAANISHELRTPLNIILGFSEIMHLSPEVYGAELVWPPTLRRDISQIYRSSSHLLSMIDDILDLSHIELSQFTMNLEPTEMSVFLLDTMNFVEDLFKDHPAFLEYVIEPNLPLLEIDRTRIRQVLLNLLNNAKRFTTEGSVRVEARLVEHDIMISVADTGPGIAAEDQSFLFNEFYQVDFSMSRKHGGAGLGLAVSKHFVQAHNGMIWVDSQIGMGAKFTFTLPVPRQTAHAESGVTRKGSPGPQVAIPPSIAIVEADGRVVDTVRRYLNTYSIVQVSDSAALPEAIHRNQPKAIIHTGLPDDWGRGETCPALPAVWCAIPGQSRLTGQSVILSSLAKPVASAKLLGELGQLPDLHRLLIIDDDRGFVQLIERMIQASPLKCRVLRAYTGEEGLAQMRLHRPDVVLLDLVLPDIDGFDWLESMQQDEAVRDTPVILLTARSGFDTMVGGDSDTILIRWPHELFSWEVLRFLQKALPGILQ